MPKVIPVIALLLTAGIAWGQGPSGASLPYKALKCPAPALQDTWALLDRDGANRQVPRYLSSLGSGEAGTGVVVSPAFRVGGDRITVTLCGHDGQGGGQEKNFVALVDAGSGEVLRKAMAPGSDAMQENAWEVSDLKGREVRIEAHDGNPGGAYAWLGIGRIDAGPGLTLDFRTDKIDGWKERLKPPTELPTEVLREGVPFRRFTTQYTIVPASGAQEIACGFAAQRLFFLGGTVPQGMPLEEYGSIELVYCDGSIDRCPLMFGYTLDLAGKTLSRSKAIHLHRSADVFQHYLVLGPRPEVIEKIVLRRNSEHHIIPRITAITAQTNASAPTLEVLPAGSVVAAEAAWIQSHTITTKSPAMKSIEAEIRRAHKLP